MKQTIEILTILSQIGDYLMPDKALYNEVRLTVRPVPTRAEFETEMQRLDSEGLVIGVTNELTAARKWKISDKGRAELAEAMS